VAHIDVESDGTCLFIKATGVLTPEEIIATLSAHYPRVRGVPRIWNLLNADLSSLTESSLAAIARATAAIDHSDSVVKTAFVTSHFATYALVTRYVLQAFGTKVRAEYRVFGQLDAAKAWIFEKR